ncbi:B3 domain-containing protein At5g38500-like [Vicia villosa]|uniref:B3 domain-containing protein At5g38500-like n=1 Tax=Vicia villosa TaxID=3911 RepID=UPI00273C9E5C|nr:B3 domain-containing protein At5g38500-like [Vicia villosa]
MEAIMDKKRKSEINALLQNMEDVKKTELKNITHMTMFLSQLAPQYYTENELAEIEKSRQSLCLEKSLQPILPNSIEGEKVDIETSLQSSDECIISCEERRVKSKILKKRALQEQALETQPLPPPELPIRLKNLINFLDGNNIKYIMSKTLSQSDLNKNLKCLSMPLTQIKSNFLTDKEKKILNTRDKKHRPVGLEVVVLDPNFKKFTMSLRMWDMTSTSIYNINQDWTLVLKENEFKEKQVFNIWSFRVNDKLHLLLDNHVEQEIEENGELNNVVVNLNNEGIIEETNGEDG